MSRPVDCLPLFSAAPFHALELLPGDVAVLQRFFDDNPRYHRIVAGENPGPGAAQEEFDSTVPDGWPFTRRWILGFFDEGAAMVGVADVIADLFAEGIWHVGLFVVATKHHGQGTAQALYASLESWMRGHGASWLRLGVVEENARAARFWEASGYVEVRRRHGTRMGAKVHTLRVMVKPLAGGSFAQYLDLVVRDRPESP